MADTENKKQNNKEEKNPLYEKPRVYGTKKQKDSLSYVEDDEERKSGFDVRYLATGVMVVFAIVIMYFMAEVMWPDAKIFNRNPVEPTATPTSTPLPEPTPLLYRGVVLSVDTEAKSVTFYDLGGEEEVTLEYANDSKFYRSTGSQTTAVTLTPGDLMLFTCRNGDETALKKAEWDSTLWEVTRIEDLQIFPEEHRISFRGKNYKYNDGVCVMNGSTRVGFDSLNAETDRVTVRGFGTDIYEIIVTTGHGILKIVNGGKMAGGVLAVGKKNVFEIEDNGEYVLREGVYKVEASLGRMSLSKEVTIPRDGVFELDLSKVEGGVTNTPTPTPTSAEAQETKPQKSRDELMALAERVSLSETNFIVDYNHLLYILGPESATVFLWENGQEKAVEVGTAPMVMNKPLGDFDILVYFGGTGKSFPYVGNDETEDVILDYSTEF